MNIGGVLSQEIIPVSIAGLYFRNKQPVEAPKINTEEIFKKGREAVMLEISIFKALEKALINLIIYCNLM